MTRRTKLALFALLVVVAGGGREVKAHRDAAHAHAEDVAEKHRARAVFAAEAITLARSPEAQADAAYAALRAIQLDHELREPPDVDRPALFDVARLGGGLERRVPSASHAPPTISASGDIVLLEGNAVSLVDGHTGEPLHRYELRGALAAARVYAERVLGVTTDGRIHAWDRKTALPVGEAYVGLATDDIELARDAPMALSCRDGACTVLDGDTKVVAKLAPPGGFTAKLVAADGTLVATAGANGAWTLFDATGAVRATITSDAPSPDARFAGARLLVSGASDVGLHDDHGKLLARLPGQVDDVCEDGSVVRLRDGGAARYFRTESGLKRAAVNGVAEAHWFAPHGRYDAIVGTDGVHVFSTDSGDEIATLHGHEGRATAVAWSANSSLLVTASEEQKVRLFDLFGTLIATIAMEGGARLAELHLLRDGKRIVTSDLSNRDVRVHDVTVDGAVARACVLAEPHARWATVASLCR